MEHEPQWEDVTGDCTYMHVPEYGAILFHRMGTGMDVNVLHAQNADEYRLVQNRLWCDGELGS